MYGNHRHNVVYYTCRRRANNRGRPSIDEAHPNVTYLREDTMLDAVSRFFADQVFGEHRRDTLAADLARVHERAARERQEEREQLQRVVADVARRQNAVLRQAQEGDPDDPFTTALRGSYHELEARKATALAAVARLDAAEDNDSNRVSAVDMALLDALPSLAFDLAEAPEPLVRKLFKSTQLTVQLADGSDHVTVIVRLPAVQRGESAHAEKAITNVTTGEAFGGYVDDPWEPDCDRWLWSYVQQRRKGGDRTYIGYINHVYGAEAERLRGELGTILRDLLRWAAHHTKD
jgi:site-specific DNA recombinase